MLVVIAFLVGVLSSLLLCALVPPLVWIILVLRSGCAFLFGLGAAICEALKEYLDKHDPHWLQATPHD